MELVILHRLGGISNTDDCILTSTAMLTSPYPTALLRSYQETKPSALLRTDSTNFHCAVKTHRPQWNIRTV